MVNNRKKKIWLLKDERLSNFSQAKGLANGFPTDQWEVEVKEIHYNYWVNLPNCLRRGLLLGLDKTKSDNLSTDFPDLVISCGRRLAPIALYIKRLAQNSGIAKVNGRMEAKVEDLQQTIEEQLKVPVTKVAHIMKPDMHIQEFDFLILPTHDTLPESIANQHQGIIKIIGALSKINPEVIKSIRSTWEERFTGYPTQRIALLVGGKAKNINFTVEDSAKLGDIASKIAEHSDHMLLVTNSRRTGTEETQTLKGHITCSNFFYDISKPSGENPFFGFFALADIIIVTGDSISMCSECCSSGKKVYIYIGETMINSRKHLEFLHALFEDGYATELTEDMTEVNNQDVKILDEGTKAAKIIASSFSE